MSNAVTSSEALTELQSNLKKLSGTLHEIYDLMNADMSQVGQAWQDGKYQEFIEGYKPQIKKCEDISVQYNLWCSKVLEPTIANVQAVERTDVGGGGSSVGSSSSGGSTAGPIAGGTASAVGSKTRKVIARGTASAEGKSGAFNMDGETSFSPRPSSEAASAIRAGEEKKSKPLSNADISGTASVEGKSGAFNMDGKTSLSSTSSSKNFKTEVEKFLNKKNKKSKPLSKADVKCIDTFGNGVHGEPATQNEAHFELNEDGGDGKLSSGLSIDVGIVKGSMGSEANSGRESSKAWIKCVPNESDN